MPVTIDELITEIEPEPDAGGAAPAPAESGGAAEAGDAAWYCAQLAQANRARERRERLLVD